MPWVSCLNISRRHPSRWTSPSRKRKDRAMCNLYRHKIRVSEIERLVQEIGLTLDPTSRSRNCEPNYTGADQDGPVLISDGKTARLETMR